MYGACQVKTAKRVKKAKKETVAQPDCEVCRDRRDRRDHQAQLEPAIMPCCPIWVMKKADIKASRQHRIFNNL